jgi:hypothetical protein
MEITTAGVVGLRASRTIDVVTVVAAALRALVTCLGGAAVSCSRCARRNVNAARWGWVSHTCRTEVSPSHPAESGGVTKAYGAIAAVRVSVVLLRVTRVEDVVDAQEFADRRVVCSRAELNEASLTKRSGIEVGVAAAPGGCGSSSVAVGVGVPTRDSPIGDCDFEVLSVVGVAGDPAEGGSAYAGCGCPFSDRCSVNGVGADGGGGRGADRDMELGFTEVEGGPARGVGL